MRELRRERGVRGLLSEGGPRLHAQLQAAGLVDDLFLTIAPKLAGGEAPRILEGDLPQIAEMELVWLLEADGRAVRALPAALSGSCPAAPVG